VGIRFFLSFCLSLKFAMLEHVLLYKIRIRMVGSGLVVRGNRYGRSAQHT
jgi:hypothetical protein